MSTIRVKIKDPCRAYYFITQYAVPREYFQNVVIETLPKASAERFFNGILLEILESEDRYGDLERLNEYIYGTGDGGGGSGIAGHISIVDVRPQSSGAVGSKIFSQDDNRLETAISSTDQLTVFIKAVTGPTNYKPNVTVNYQPVSISEDINNETVWLGSVDIVLPIDGIIIAEHEDGAEDTANIVLIQAPQVVSAEFINGYPGSQTELKEGDTFDLLVTSDSPMTRITVLNQGAAKYQVYNFPETTSHVVTVTIDDSGDVATLRPAVLNVSNSSGATGSNFSTDSLGSIDGTNVVNCNNLYPTVSFGGIDYPLGQMALKNSETADVAFSYSDVDDILFTSPNGQLSISGTTTLESIKTVTRVGGSYNITSPNIAATATRTANMAVSATTGVVYIANVVASLSVANIGRLRSGGNAGTVVQNHTITINSNQRLLSPPLLDETPGAGVFLGSWAGSGTSFSRILQVHDNHPNGIFQFQNFSAVGLAGIVALTLPNYNYELGGFVKRRLYYPALNNEVAIGAVVYDYTNLVGLDKDLAAMTYQNSLGNSVRGFSITGPSLTLNQSGNILFWADQQEVNNNTTGLSFIEIEETQ